MGGEVDPISMILGELRAHHENAKGASALIMQKIDNLDSRLSLLERIETRVASAEETIEEHDTKITAHDKVFHRAAGFGMAAGTLSGFIGWLFK